MVNPAGPTGVCSRVGSFESSLPDEVGRPFSIFVLKYD